MSDKASTAKLLASGNASVDVVLGRMDLPDHLNNNCNVGANLRYFIQFTEKNLPRIIAAVQKPATLGASTTGPVGGRFFDVNDQGGANTLLAARNASALLVKYCQCCEKRTNSSSAMSGAVATPSHDSPLGKVVPVMIGIFSRRGEIPDSVALDVQRILLASIETDHETTLHNINITLRSDIVTGVVRHLSSSMTISETLVSLFGSALNAKAMMMEVADPSAFVVKWVEHDFHLRLVNHLNSAMKNIDCAPYFFFFQEMLKRAFSPNVGPMVDQILSEQCFGRLFDIAVTAAEDMLKVRKVKKGSAAAAAVKDKEDGAADSATDSESTANNASDVVVEGETPRIATLSNNGSIGRTISGISAITTGTAGGDDGEVEYPYLAEALNLVFQCVGIIRRSLPPPESEQIYMSRRLPLSHGPVFVMLRYLPRLVGILRSAVPSKFRPSSYIVRRHRSAVERLRVRESASVSISASENGDVAPFAAGDSSSAFKSGNNIASRGHREGPLISPSLNGENEDSEDLVRVGDDLGDESDTTSIATTTTSAAGYNNRNRKQSNAGGGKGGATGNSPFSATSVPPRTVFGPARLAITDIIVELTLFRSRVCDEALVASGAIEALLDCAEVFANHDLLLRNVHRVIMAVMQRPAYSEISLASNVTAAIAASEAAQKTMAQQKQAQQSGGLLSGGATDKSAAGGLSSNLSFASNTFENGTDAHPSFMGLDDLRQQYSSSSISFDDEDEDDSETGGRIRGRCIGEGDDSDDNGLGSSYYDTCAAPSIDDELHFQGGKTIIARKGHEQPEPSTSDGAKKSSATSETTPKSRAAPATSRHRRHPHLLSKDRREALEAEKLIERQILHRLDRATLAMVHVDPLVRFLVQKRPLTELLYAWASTPEVMSAEEQAMMPEGQKAFRDFTNTSLQVHATQMIQRLKEVGASHTIKNECNETLHCNDEISSKLALWQRPITGDRYVEKGSGCTEEIVHRPMIIHRDTDYSNFMDDEDDDDGADNSRGDSYGVSSGTSGSTTLDFDADNLISGRSRATNNSDHTAESPDKITGRSASSGSLDDFQNEDVTGEAAALISPRKRSNSIGREHRYAAAYESDEDIGNTSGGLFTEDSSMLGFGIGAGILKDEPCHLDGSSPGSSSSANVHQDPFSNISGASDDYASPVVTRPRSRHSAGPPPDPTEDCSRNTAAPVEAFDESAFETRVLEDRSDESKSPPQFGRYFDDVPEFKPQASEQLCTEESEATSGDSSQIQNPVVKTRTSRANSSGKKSAVAIRSDDDEDEASNSNAATILAPSNGPRSASTGATNPASKFKVTYTGRAGAGPRSSVSPHNTAASGHDDSFELDEDVIGVIEKTRGVSVDSSVDSDTADMIFDRQDDDPSKAEITHDDGAVNSEDEIKPESEVRTDECIDVGASADETASTEIAGIEDTIKIDAAAHKKENDDLGGDSSPTAP